MIPERKEEIKYSKANVTWMTLQDYVSELLAALEEAQQDIETLKVLNHEFLVASKKRKDDIYKQLAEANQTIASYRKTLEEIAADSSRTVSAWSMILADKARAALEGETQP